MTASLLHTFRKESIVFEDLLRSIREGDAFYDVGANLGAFACLARDAISDGEIVAFEPHPDNISRLKRNAELNDADIITYPVALSNESGDAELSVDLGRAGNQRHALATDGEGRTIGIETETGDRLIAAEQLPPPTVVKVDVEGAELPVIEGLSESLASDVCRLVYCEIHPELMDQYEGTPQAVREALEDAGFELETIHESGGQSYLRGRK